METIAVPSVFSLTENTSATMMFFSNLHRLLKGGRPVRFDASDVEVTTPDALLYLLSVMDLWRQQLGSIRVTGYSPRKPEARRFWEKSGFLKYVKSSLQHVPSSDFMPIRRGETAEGGKVSELQQFAILHLRSDYIEQAHIQRRLYDIFMECMGNTIEHSLYDGKNKRHTSKPRWYMSAVHERNNGEQYVRFCFLDNGYGIPNTVHRRWSESLKGISSDHELLRSAMDGSVLRSQTQYPHRGKGLPRIKQTAMEGIVKKLVVLSGRAYYSVQESDCRKLDRKFSGTLFVWDFYADENVRDA